MHVRFLFFDKIRIFTAHFCSSSSSSLWNISVHEANHGVYHSSHINIIILISPNCLALSLGFLFWNLDL
ncbi:hypothetical protein KFK09_028049 [Dendrobium nobile]|uniref:Uncharacterized protein n=1 Tax=Dendrobium nobile TaxID=94219 RepID=A0A8T3A2C2_DENNO|nr:hypothetical protein KFK09_028049 [Dendrobium nobile]